MSPEKIFHLVVFCCKEKFFYYHFSILSYYYTGYVTTGSLFISGFMSLSTPCRSYHVSKILWAEETSTYSRTSF